ncbi:hypothetical protein CO173_00245 [Candidatus Uhrbacteria bacterium CG_4_9_14_3_um_filter_41_35]|uniref:EfeO-type cupredoxin-like domain-containing protein n=1 Tax=Candidatus Uhrbacteria bacterium CG_4_9_14_3_um_filter_41_35 TaxID=1975034 RepID=A0A2M7XGS1_9BACT|nr:MAG: hypothetical protein COV92_00540 [Candidatus Uhrbacteria bacterium CG11_big_fil_rev_8_21_14_0_20_41_9]PJA47080.1 MAG: hypothetical protein CO173_00245 [Candidatus Uhrbacteria bacterium CG_4_9_14_3_um_filter_41_35]
MKRFGLVVLLLVLAGAGCSSEEMRPAIEQENSNQVIQNSTNALTEQLETATAVEIVVDGDGEFNVQQIETDQTLPVKKVNMTARNSKFEPASIATQVNQRVEVTFGETSGTHTFVVDALGVSETVKAGETIQFVSPAKAGSYEFYSNIGNDQVDGMVGVLHVKEL